MRDQRSRAPWSARRASRWPRDSWPLYHDGYFFAFRPLLPQAAKEVAQESWVLVCP